MKLVEIDIQNFRGIKSLNIPIDRLTVLIGENNVGKSTVIEALKLVLTRGFGSIRGKQFSEYDFHLNDTNATPKTAESIRIVLHFAEEQQDEWPVTITQQMNEVIQLDSTTGLNHIWLQAKGAFNSESRSFETKLSFLNSNMTDLNSRNSTYLNLLQGFVPLFFLSALRDASQEFGQRGQFWSGFLKSINLPDASRQEIEQKLEEINTSVIGANEGLNEVIQKIAEAKRLVPLDSTDPVILETIPTRIFDMVGNIQVYLRSTFGVKLPLNKHGEGTQSLAVLMLFQAFAAANLTEAYSPESAPILALEEPEAHLHPSAIRSLGAFLESLVGQVIVSSHSGDLLSRVPITSIRRLYKKNGQTVVGQIQTNALTSEEERHFDYHVRITKGSHLFARCWLLVEGQSEFWFFPEVIALMHSGIGEMNFAVIEFSQGGGPPPFIKAAKSLGIEWFVVADGDRAGTNYINQAKSCLAVSETENDRMMQLSSKDIEHEFWNAGYEDVYKNPIQPPYLLQLQTQYSSNLQEFADAVIKKAIDERKKPKLAMDLVVEIRRRGVLTLPQTIQDVIARVVNLSGG
ncbi:MAG: ATP-dependent nuclease [Pseudanabaena sp.]|jgi:putative ATP-dependent endonuclease of OLD family